MDRPGFAPAPPLAIGLLLALAWLSLFPALRWLCIAADALLQRLLP